MERRERKRGEMGRREIGEMGQGYIGDREREREREARKILMRRA